MKKFIQLLMSLMLCFASSSTFACLHFPGSYRGQMREGLQEAFLFHDGEQAHLVIRTRLQADKFPSEIAWVLPFPSLPSKYEEVNGPFFEELKGLFPSPDRKGSDRAKPADHAALGSAKTSSIQIYEPIRVGSYQIQPIEILKESASTELTEWLKKNKFNSMPAELQKPYLKKGAAFLAIRSQIKHPTAGQLQSQSLHIVYKADSLSLPIKFTHPNRTFDLDLYVFSSKELKKDLKTFYFDEPKSAAHKSDGLLPFVDDVIGKRSGFVTLYQAQDLNAKKQKLAKLVADPVFQLSEIK